MKRVPGLVWAGQRYAMWKEFFPSKGLGFCARSPAKPALKTTLGLFSAGDQQHDSSDERDAS